MSSGLGSRFFEKHKVTPSDLVNHLFLPKRQPQKAEPNLINIEQAILEYLCETSRETLLRHNFTKVHHTLENWADFLSGRNNARNILENLRDEESACFYVRKQNCTMQFTKLDGNMRVITFRSSMPNEIITGTRGSPGVTYPETVDFVAVSPFLLSECFSNQLEYLTSNTTEIAGPHQKEMREPPFPFVVSEFLVKMLCPKESIDFEKNWGFASIKTQKKLRDQINWSGGNIPFRRSGLWISIKVILQMNLEEEMRINCGHGRLMYKIIIIQILASVAFDYSQMIGARWNIIAQTLVKLARRSKKLTEMEKSGNANLETQREDTLKQVAILIKDIHAIVTKEWQGTDFSPHHSLNQVTKITHEQTDWIKDCIHKMVTLTNHLNADRIPKSILEATLIDNLKIIDPVIQIQGDKLQSLLTRFNSGLSTANQDFHLNYLSVWIYQVEWFARHELLKTHNCKQIFDLLLAYTKTVFSLYGRTYADPMYVSWMTITVLKFVAVLEEIVMDKHPMLRMYKTGIQPEMFESLLIPEKCDMLLVEALQKYFMERNSNATHSDWLGESSCNKYSFPVKFAQSNPEMQQLKSRILADSEERIRQKREELQKVRDECIELENQIQRCECSFILIMFRHHHDRRRCRLQAQLNRLRKSVAPYQRPLPPKDYRRDAVVFELRVPEEIVYLRDGVCIFLNEILGYPVLIPQSGSQSIKWMQFNGLTEYCPARIQHLVHLGSETKDTLTSHCGRSNPDVMNCDESSFILENGLTCKMFKLSHLDSALPPSSFTLQINQTDSKGAASYQALQFTLNTGRPTENQVIAQQSTCHQNVTVMEFITFGSVRSGENIQLRNLYAAIASQILSLEKEPVVALIMQTIWELGPGKREIHVDFEHTIPFCHEFLELLDKLCDANATNWGNPMVLMSLALVTVRILEMTESVEVNLSATAILQKFRTVTEQWCIKLEALISKLSDTKKKEENELTELLLKASICSAFTFNVSSDVYLQYVFKDPSDVAFWLKTLSRLQHLVVRKNILQKSPQLSPFFKNLLRHARLTIPLNLQDYLCILLERDLRWNMALHHYVCSKWQGAVNVRDNDVPTFCHSGNRDLNKKHAYQGEYKLSDCTHLVCVDILRGTFLVDGFPPSSLPETIIRHPLFTSYFRTSKFRVQRDSQTFKTVDKYCGHHFEFTETVNSLVIRQTSGLSDGNFIEILPRNLFGNLVAHDLIENFTHWYDSKTKVIYFRRPSRLDSQVTIENYTDYILKPITTGSSGDPSMIPQEWHLKKCTGTNNNTSTSLVSIHSVGFRKIIENFRKLENERFIHVHYEETKDDTGTSMTSIITSKLWRFNMSFSVNQVEGLLYCDNYPEYYVPVLEGQRLKTLLGVQSGLVLEKRTMSEFSGKKKLLLIQHGIVKINESGKHQAVYIEGALRYPPYFVFEVDQVLHRLRPGNSKSAWLYLALLHASTSSPFPDPFTQLTGTEMAIWILQSCFVWSCSPYDLECLTSLRQIASLSPTYLYYPNYLRGIQNTVWPQGLENNCYAAYDGYAFIQEKLLADSSRLAGLFRESSRNHNPATNMELCKRSYYRNINMYNRVAHLTSEFIDHWNNFQNGTTSVLPSYQKSQQVNDDLTILALSRQRQIPAPYSQTVTSFIMTSEQLPHDRKDNLTKAFLGDWFVKTLRENWLRLYSLCSSANLKEKKEHELTMIFGAMLYSGKCSLGQLLNLHNVTVGKRFASAEIPEPVRSLTKQNFEPFNHHFISTSVSQILRGTAKTPPSQRDFDTYKKYQEARNLYGKELSEQVTVSTTKIQRHWPAKEICYSELRRAFAGNDRLNCTTNCHANINSLFIQWYNNLELKNFVDNVDKLLVDVARQTRISDFTQLHKRTDLNMMYEIATDLPDVWIEQQFSFQDITSPITFANSPDAQIFSTGKLPGSISQSSSSKQYQRSHSKQLAEKISCHLSDRVKDNSHIKYSLRMAGIHVRLAPIILLRDYLLNSNAVPDKDAALMIGSLAALWTNIKRLNRLIMFQEKETRFSVELAREQETGECENWNPREHPEWLLLELELDLTIRRIQVDVATHMMEMPGGKNGVMQLNMGEGKTSVIVPMVVSTLALKQTMLCRVTVLNSIFATNKSLLSFAIGGFLNKRVYTVPCSRDFDINRYLDTMATMYKECMRLGGVLITLPEYRLSFRLQMYNKFLQNQMEVGFKIHEIESWLRKNARDIVDESDEIFSVKYQLIYTTGKQLPMDGGNMRWTVCQKIFELIPQVATHLFDKYGPDVIEFQPEVAKDSPEQFPHLRILNNKCKAEFYELMADSILDGKVDLLAQILTNNQRTILREFLVNANISEEDHQEVLAIEDLTASKKEIVFLISGYLRRGILFAALKKRWRVECGVKVSKPGTCSKLMAVPFRAKDVAAERTEFGHPDMAIVLTQLSYYYSGLNDEQLFQCFHILDTAVTGPDAMYNSWIRKIPDEKIKSDTIKSYKGINLQDYEQRTKHLFPLLRKHKAVVDFWLENVVFPKECRQFPGKLVTNAWDLCYERFIHPTTGFSGTNDTSLLLPTQISQQDLKVLMDTNSQMEATLKGEENEYKRTLKMGASCIEVLQYIIKDDLQVLIDAGALMLELKNEKLAELWLELDKGIEGVVYFNDSGEMFIKVRQQGYQKKEKDELLTLSSFRDRLDMCAVYLDDQHTRGTDIKLGTGSKACITVGSGMRRDKLIQACMRMRKLGKGQSVHFYLSHEVHNKINLHKSTELPITVQDILNWVKWNSGQFEKDGLAYWATNARNYAKNLAADDLFELSDKSITERGILARRCEDSDAQKLTKMYGTYYHRILLIELIPGWFSLIKTKLTEGTNLLLQKSVLLALEVIQTQVLEKCREHIPDKVSFHSMLEEEQEKELEPEQEEHVEKYLPLPKTPVVVLVPSLHDNVLQCVTTTGTPAIVEGISCLHDMFKDTTIWSIIQDNGWGNQWYVSEDFIRVLQSEPGENLDCYLRPMTYFVSFTKKRMATTCILLLSQFEVNKLIRKFRENKCAENATLHMFTGRRMDGQSTFANNTRLQLPFRLKNQATLLDIAVMTPMLIAAGNLYFDSMEGQKAFARFLGLALRPWSEDQEDACRNGWITATGFVTSICSSLRAGCSFQDDPTEMVRGILKIRNEVLRDTDHTVQMLERCAFISLDEDKLQFLLP